MSDVPPPAPGEPNVPPDDREESPVDEIIRWFLFDDRPVSIAGDLLWSGDSSIRPRIQEVARTITCALTPSPDADDGDPEPSESSMLDASAHSMTFAVYGGWGSGKSSLLQMISDAILAEAGDDAHRVIFCRFNAWSHQARSADVRELLALRAATAIAGDHQRAVNVFAPYARAISGEPDGDDAVYEPSTGGTARRGVLQRSIAKLVELYDLDRVLELELSPHGRSSGGAQRVLVFLIDELDRCRPEFVGDVLDTIQWWSEIPSMFFVLAVDEQALTRAVALKYRDIAPASRPEHSLEKYVQMEIRIPDLAPRELREFILALLRPFGNDPVASALVEDVGLFQAGLRYWRPRAVKRVLNAIRPELQNWLRAHPGTYSTEQRRLLVKQRILEYAWPAFYSSLFMPAIELGRQPYHNAFLQLERICEWLSDAKVNMTSSERAEVLEVFVHQLQRIPELAQFEMSSELAELLAIPPMWRTRQPDSRDRPPTRPPTSPGIESAGPSGAGRPSSDGAAGAGVPRPGPKPVSPGDGAILAPEPTEPPADGVFLTPERLTVDPVVVETAAPSVVLRSESRSMTPGPALPAGRAHSQRLLGALDDELNDLYFQAEAAFQAGRREEARELAEQLYRLIVDNRQAFGTRHCPTVGNIALTVESLNDIALAQRLYELAMELNPEHSNNLQNFADFIIDSQIESLFPLAESILSKLTTGAHALHKPERTRTLRLRLNILLQQQGAMGDLTAEAQQLVDAFVANPTSVRELTEIMDWLNNLKDVGNQRRVARAFYEATRSPDERYAALRLLADALASSGDPGGRREAMAIYRYFYTNQEHRDRANWLHNYATLLLAHNYDAEAGRLWYEAYALLPQDTSIRRAYGQALMQARRPDLALAVSRGEPLAEVVARENGQPLPERFIDSPCWWETPADGAR